MKYSCRLSEEKVTIFLLHGVIDAQVYRIRNYTNKHITSEFFYNFLTDLCKNGTALSMDDIVYHISNDKKFPKNAFAITFDDGFENNFSIARPLLQQFKVPATFYVTTDFVEKNKMSWIDRIEWAVEHSESGRIQCQNDILSFNVETQSKINFLNLIRKILKKVKSINLDEVATDIQMQLGFMPILTTDDPLDKKMNWDQVVKLSQEPLWIVGGHTCTHPVLANLNDIDSENEITESLKTISEKLNIKCTHFSYPEGLSNCYSQREITILKNNGIVCSPSAEDGTNSIGSNLFHLRRVAVI